MHNILLYTATGACNLGDEHILAEEVRYLLIKFPDAHISIATYDENATREMLENLLSVNLEKRISFLSYFPHGLRSRFFQNIYYFAHNIVSIFQADLVIIGGGGLFYDSEK